MVQGNVILRKIFGTAGLQILSRALSVLLAILLARYLGADDFGTYSYVLSIITVLAIPVIAGMPRFLMREVSNNIDDGKYNEIKGLLIFFTLYIFSVSIFVFYIFEMLSGYDFFSENIYSLLLIAILIIPIRGFLTLNSSIFTGLSSPLLGQLPILVFVPFIQLSLMYILILTGNSFSTENQIYILIVSSLLSVFFSFYVLFKVIPKQIFLISSKYEVKSWLYALLPFTLLSVVTTVNVEFSSLALGYYVDEKTVGFFKVALRAVGLVSLLLQAINIVIGPKIAVFYKDKKNKELQLLVQKSLWLSILFSIPVVLVLSLFSEFLVILLFGNEYKTAATPLTIMCVGQVFNVLFGPVDLVLNMTKNEKTTLKIVSISAISSVLMLIIFVPLFGLNGAAYATIISVFITKGIMAYIVYKKLGIKVWPSIGYVFKRFKV